MSGALLLVAGLSVLVGLSLGVLGGGGSILMVPILVYAAGMDPKEAIASSLVIVGATSALGAIRHARAGRVRWRAGLLFGTAGTAGAIVGSLVGRFIPGQVLLAAFAVMMLATSFAMIRGRPAARAAKEPERPMTRTLADGVGVGLLTGLVGVGGGFLAVPALALLGGLPMATAVGTSLVVITMNSAAGLLGHLAAVPVNWGTTTAATGAAILGSLVGAPLADRLPEASLRKGFGWFVLAMGAFVLIQQAPAELRWGLAAITVAVAAGALACRAFVPKCPLRHRRT